MSNLAPFISWVGHGAASLAQPGVFTGAQAHLFTVKASASAMQGLADNLLNKAGRGLVRYETVVGRSLVTFMDIARCTSGTDVIGWVPGRECAIWVPLLEIHPGRPFQTRLVLWAPYIYIDYTIGMLTGREVWGWPKVAARIAMADDTPEKPAAFTCSTTIFETLAVETMGRCVPLFSVSSTTPLQRPPPDWEDGSGAGRSILSEVLSGVASEIVAALHLQPVLPAIALKQFRDSANAGFACFQAIVDSPARITRFGGGGLLPGDFTLQITTCQSHQIVNDLLGVAPQSGETLLPVQWAAWASFDFEALPGNIIVSAP